MYQKIKYINTLTLENRIPIRTYTYRHKDIDELFEDLDKKEYLISTFCFENNWYFDRQILAVVGKEEYIVQFDVYSL
jgi:hypothetical protein